MKLLGTPEGVGCAHHHNPAGIRFEGFRGEGSEVRAQGEGFRGYGLVVAG